MSNPKHTQAATKRVDVFRLISEDADEARRRAEWFLGSDMGKVERAQMLEEIGRIGLALDRALMRLNWLKSTIESRMPGDSKKKADP